MTKAKTTVQLSRAIDADGRMVDQVVIAGAPGDDRLPVSEDGGNYDIDALAVISIMVRRTGLSKAALEKLSTIDLLTVGLTLFLPFEKRKPKK